MPRSPYLSPDATDMREAIIEVAKDRCLSFDELDRAVSEAMRDIEGEVIAREEAAIERADAICHARMEARHEA